MTENRRQLDPNERAALAAYYPGQGTRIERIENTIASTAGPFGFPF